MKKAVQDGTAKILTTSIAESLKGKRIQTIYFGYRGQDGVDDFIVGDIKILPQNNTPCLFTSEGRNTYMFAHEENSSAFTCSDSDRFVKFIEINEN